MIVVDESEPVGGKEQSRRANIALHGIIEFVRAEIEPPFESRDVQIRRGLNVRDFFDMEEEIGR